MADQRADFAKSSKRGLYADRPWYRPSALARRLINYYLAICLALFFMQNYLLFPRWISGAVMSQQEAFQKAKDDAGFLPWSPTPKLEDFKGYVRSDFSKVKPRGTIVVFHGNAGCAFSRAYYDDAFYTRGFRTLLYEYPGYGGRAGSPSLKSIVGDARSVIQSLDRNGYGPVYVWGESVGSGIAAEVCRDNTLPIHGLVLLTPWDSLVHAAAYHYPFIPVSLLVWDKYDSIQNLAYFQHPICVICSDNDTVLPPKLGLNLFEHLPGPKKLILQRDCGHNDWPSALNLSWWDDALDFIAPKH